MFAYKKLLASNKSFLYHNRDNDIKCILVDMQRKGMGFKILFLSAIILAMTPSAIHGATIVNFGATLCGDGQVMSDGKCIDRVQNKCPSNYYESLISSETFSSPSTEDNSCVNSYDYTTLSESMRPLYSGTIVNFGATLCGDGQYLSNGACVSQKRGACPESFYDVTVNDATVIKPENAQCASGYESSALTANCASNDVQSGICVILCDAGLAYTGTGACAALCSVNPGRNVTLNASGISIPLYQTRVTTPTLAVMTSNGDVCYGNLVPGTKPGAINVTVSDKNYYASN